MTGKTRFTSHPSDRRGNNFIGSNRGTGWHSKLVVAKCSGVCAATSLPSAGATQAECHRVARPPSGHRPTKCTHCLARDCQSFWLSANILCRNECGFFRCYSYISYLMDIISIPFGHTCIPSAVKKLFRNHRSQ